MDFRRFRDGHNWGPRICATLCCNNFEPSRAEPHHASSTELSRAEPSRAAPSRTEPSQSEPSRAEPHRRAGLIHPNTRSPASGGLLCYFLFWYAVAGGGKIGFVLESQHVGNMHSSHRTLLWPRFVSNNSFKLMGAYCLKLLVLPHRAHL